MKISAVIIAKNEEEDIGRCLAGLEFCDEIIVIDDSSTDKTKSIASREGAKVFSRSLEDFSKQRNFGLKKAKGGWVLFVDADEVVSPQLRREILEVIKESEGSHVGYFIKRKDVLWGKELKYGETGSICLLRLALKDKGKWRRKVHEYWNVQGKVGSLSNPLKHYPHGRLSDFMRSLNQFSTIHADANFDEGKKSSIGKIFFYPIIKFINNYFVKLGVLDGLEGFLHAIFMSFHSYLSWSKLWLIQKKR